MLESYENVQNEPQDISPSLDGGIMKRILKYGIGTSTPTNGSITIHYIGKLVDGTIFDNGFESTPFIFVIGSGKVMKAIENAVTTMRKGEVAEFTYKPEYICSIMKFPRDVDVIIQIELIGWTSEDVSPRKDGTILKTILDHGRGYSTPNDAALVDVHITGEYDGNVFEDRDVCFNIGEGSAHNVIKGVELALGKFKKKEKSELIIKPKYGLAAARRTELNIPPNADLKYTVHLKDFEKNKESWSITPSEKLEQANFFKNKGSDYVSKNNWSLAIKMYKKANDYVAFDVGFSEEEEIERKKLHTSILLNLALCYLKTDDFVSAKDNCLAVLKIDPNNVKAHFRMGQARMQLTDPSGAKESFEKVLSLDEKNKTAAKLISECDKLICLHRQREKSIFANMFDKFAKRDIKKEEEERKQQPDVMKTLGEWGKDERAREPTNFEKENPNILMLDGTGDFKNM